MDRRNKFIDGDEFLERTTRGMETSYRSVSRTMGAAGKNVAFLDYSYVKTTNDGVSIAGENLPEDKLEYMGAQWIKQPARTTVDEAGDGTSTAIVLSYHMVIEGLKKIRAGANANKLKRQIAESASEIITKLKKRAIKIKTDEELFNVANTSVESPEIAKIVAEAVKRVGPDGDIIVEESNGLDIQVENIDGYRWENGFTSPYMITNPHTMECVFEKPLVLVSDKKFQMNRDLFPLLEDLVQRGERKLLLIGEELTGEAMSTVIANRVNPQVPIHVTFVRKPYYLETLEDIAALVGATTLTEAKGIQELGPQHVSSLGRAKKVIVTPNSCLIVGENKYKDKVQERVELIHGSMKLLKPGDGHERRTLKERLARLNGAVTIISVGAPTRADMKYLKDKIDDAVGATRAAVEEGIVIGGGRALYDISLEKPKNDGDEIVKKACGQPIRRIIENAGENAELILAGLKDGEIFNVYTGKVSTNPIEEGLIDPAKVERCALKNSANFAGLFLATHGAFEDLPQKQGGKDSESVL